MKRIFFFCFLCLSSSLWAEETPTPSREDGRIQTVSYNAGDVVVVSVRTGRAAYLVFSKKETITNVASGFTAGWEIIVRGNLLFLKAKSLQGEGGATLPPKPEQWNTNLIVTTSERLYDFELRVVSPQEPHAYRVEFTYPDDELANVNEKKSSEQLATKLPPKNWNYSAQLGRKSEGIVPSMAYDDGVFTYLRFSKEFPAVFQIGIDGSETLVNFHVEGDVLVVHQVSRQLVLRFGKSVVSLYNDSFQTESAVSPTGTTAPNTIRELKEPK